MMHELHNNVLNELLEIWVNVEWLKEQQHQIKYEMVLFLQEKKTMFIMGMSGPHSCKTMQWIKDSNDF